MDVFPLVYRCCVVVKPKQPMADWINKTDPLHKLSLEDTRQDSNVYLVPDFEDDMDTEQAIEKYLKANYQGIFLHELTDWYLEPETYPKMTYSLFLEWFEISMHTMVFDMVNAPITKE